MKIKYLCTSYNKDNIQIGRFTYIGMVGYKNANEFYDERPDVYWTRKEIFIIIDTIYLYGNKLTFKSLIGLLWKYVVYTDILSGWSYFTNSE